MWEVVTLVPTSLTLTLWFQRTDSKELTLLLQHTDTEGIHSDDGFHGGFFHMGRAFSNVRALCSSWCLFTAGC